MDGADRTGRAGLATGLGRAAVKWMVEPGSSDPNDLSLYHGQAGILLAIREAQAHVGGSCWAAALDRGADALAGGLDRLSDSSLYFGLSGAAFALEALGRHDAARESLRRVAARRRGDRWGVMSELLAGNAGIGLAALGAGDLDLAVSAVALYLETSTRTDHGVNWPVRPTPPRSHHIAHGTLGIVYALASIGHAADRPDLVELALAGAADVVGRNEAGPDGFLVPHSDPPHRPDLVERYSLGWCNGPAGDAQVFRLLGQVTGDPDWRRLVDRCWQTVTTSGLPHRLRPGFWDNNGRCCGTAGVLALAVDRVVECGDSLEFADRLVEDLAVRATVDAAGARWSNIEQRADPPGLSAQAGWAMGNAGIVRELLRYARVCVGGTDAYAAPWPDHPPTRPTPVPRSTPGQGPGRRPTEDQV